MFSESETVSIHLKNYINTKVLEKNPSHDDIMRATPLLEPVNLSCKCFKGKSKGIQYANKTYPWKFG